jgi:hypothetical protein
MIARDIAADKTPIFDETVGLSAGQEKAYSLPLSLEGDTLNNNFSVTITAESGSNYSKSISAYEDVENKVTFTGSKVE